MISCEPTPPTTEATAWSSPPPLRTTSVVRSSRTPRLPTPISARMPLAMHLRRVTSTTTSLASILDPGPAAVGGAPGSRSYIASNASAARSRTYSAAHDCVSSSASWRASSLPAPPFQATSSANVRQRSTRRCAACLQKNLTSVADTLSSARPAPRSAARTCPCTASASAAALSWYTRCRAMYTSVVEVMSGMLPSSGMAPPDSVKNAPSPATLNQKSGDDAVSDSSAGSASRSRTFDGTVSGFHTWRAAPAASRKFSSSCVRCADRIWSLNARCALVPSGAVPPFSSAPRQLCAACSSSTT
mmetsp:Transcript_37332/g.92793  ORF Transcript_37332/g.92793 Transcript_37332/m.92793 type:complete len:302 (-) Transcript_37332:700-1605(-)